MPAGHPAPAEMTSNNVRAFSEVFSFAEKLSFKLT
jgi:hypothetical protein